MQAEARSGMWSQSAAHPAECLRSASRTTVPLMTAPAVAWCLPCQKGRGDGVADDSAENWCPGLVKLLFPDLSVCEICQVLVGHAQSRTPTGSGNCPLVTKLAGPFRTSRLVIRDPARER